MAETPCTTAAMIEDIDPQGPGKGPLYAMHWLGSTRLRALVSEGKLTCGHVGVLWFVVDHMGRNGCAWISGAYLAEVLRRGGPQTCRELKRLIDLQLIVRIRDERTGQAGFMVNPWVAHVGPIESRFAAWGRFKEHLPGGRARPGTLGCEVEAERLKLEAA